MKQLFTETFNKHANFVTEKVLLENKKQAKLYVVQGKLSQEDFDTLVSIDPSPTKKYVGWMAKQFIEPTKSFSIDDLRNNIEEYHSFAVRDRVKTKDINQFKSFADLAKEVHELNQMGAGVSDKDLEEDYETIVDNDKMLICVPHTHEASRKLGLSKFAFRNCEGGGKDSAWCTTYKAPNHFNDYYYKQGVTFYYVLIRNEELLKVVEAAFPTRGISMKVVALVVHEGGGIDGYDGEDKKLSSQEVTKYKKLVGLR